VARRGRRRRAARRAGTAVRVNQGFGKALAASGLAGRCAALVGDLRAYVLSGRPGAARREVRRTRAASQARAKARCVRLRRVLVKLVMLVMPRRAHVAVDMHRPRLRRTRSRIRGLARGAPVAPCGSRDTLLYPKQPSAFHMLSQRQYSEMDVAGEQAPAEPGAPLGPSEARGMGGRPRRDPERSASVPEAPVRSGGASPGCREGGAGERNASAPVGEAAGLPLSIGGGGVHPDSRQGVPCNRKPGAAAPGGSGSRPASDQRGGQEHSADAPSGAGMGRPAGSGAQASSSGQRGAHASTAGELPSAAALLEPGEGGGGGGQCSASGQGEGHASDAGAPAALHAGRARTAARSAAGAWWWLRRSGASAQPAAGGAAPDLRPAQASRGGAALPEDGPAGQGAVGPPAPGAGGSRAAPSSSAGAAKQAAAGGVCSARSAWLTYRDAGLERRFCAWQAAHSVQARRRIPLQN